jgi:hypothetical protein
MGNRAALGVRPQRHYQEKQPERTTGLEPATLTLAKKQKGRFFYLPFIENHRHDLGFTLTAIDRD